MIDQMGRWYPDYPGQQPQQDPQFMRMMGFAGQSQNNQNNQSSQSMTPPTIHAEIIQYGSEDEVDRHPMAAGTSQMFVSRDETTFIVKTMHQGGQYDKEYYDKRPPAPPAPTLNPAEYVRKDELAAFMAAWEAERGGAQHESV